MAAMTKILSPSAVPIWSEISRGKKKKLKFLKFTPNIQEAYGLCRPQPEAATDYGEVASSFNQVGCILQNGTARAYLHSSPPRRHVSINRN